MPKSTSLSTRVYYLSEHIELLWRALGEILQPQASTFGNGISLEALNVNSQVLGPSVTFPGPVCPDHGGQNILR